MGIYLAMYLRRVVEGSAFASSTMVALVVAVVLLVLVVVLGATSFRWVKRKMKASSWLALQRLAYVFYGLVYAHLMFMIGPSAFAGAQPALTNAVVYTVLFAVYAFARVWRAAADRRERVKRVDTVRDQGFAEV